MIKVTLFVAFIALLVCLGIKKYESVKGADISAENKTVMAQCVDKSFSYSKSRAGSCSHHGGVLEWVNK